MTGPHDTRRGLATLLGAFAIWGLLPLYLRELRMLPPLLIVGYRLVLGCLVVMIWLGARGELSSVRSALSESSTRRRLIASALLISTNWMAFVWAISHGRVVESSLGYFITPLVNVSLGVCLLGERLRRLQWIAVALAAVGVIYLTLLTRAMPWIAFALAFSFGGYGLLRKTVAVEAMAGLAAETLVIAPIGAAYVLWSEWSGRGAWALGGSTRVLGLLSLSGVITAFPLWLFSYGARRVPLTTLGLMQYLAPSVQLALGIFLFHEPFDAQRMLGFGLIWSGLVVYTADSVRLERGGSRTVR